MWSMKRILIPQVLSVLQYFILYISNKYQSIHFHTFFMRFSFPYVLMPLLYGPWQQSIKRTKVFAVRCYWRLLKTSYKGHITNEEAAIEENNGTPDPANRALA